MSVNGESGYQDLLDKLQDSLDATQAALAASQSRCAALERALLDCRNATDDTDIHIMIDALIPFGSALLATGGGRGK